MTPGAIAGARHPHPRLRHQLQRTRTELAEPAEDIDGDGNAPCEVVEVERSGGAQTGDGEVLQVLPDREIQVTGDGPPLRDRPSGSWPRWNSRCGRR